MEILILASAKRVVFVTIVVLVEVRFDPLTELKVIQRACLHQLGDIDVPLDTILVEGGLEHFVVLDVLVLAFGAPLNTGEGERARVEGVHDCAVDGTSGALLNFSQLQLQKGTKTTQGDYKSHTQSRHVVGLD